MMKKIVFIFVFLAGVVNAQEHMDEAKLIEETVLTYIENFFENKFDEMKVSLHPRLAKRGLNQNGTLSEDFPLERLKELMDSKRAFPKAHQENKVEDIRVFGNMASASLITGYPSTRWVEYIHLVKLEGKWQIINVFWDFKKKKKNG